MKNFDFQRWLPIICLGIAVALALTILTFGFWVTLLVAIFAAVGYGIGLYMQRECITFSDIVDRLITKFR